MFQGLPWLSGPADPDTVAIVCYDDRHAEAFGRLNREWLERYGLLEEGDRKHLEHPRESILAAGGEIFVALEGDAVVGTCAVTVRDAGTVELAKLAVDPSAQGRGLGRRLSEAAISWARARGARTIVLVSSTKLTAALRLYERLGFRHGPVPADTEYVTADVYMELALDTPEPSDATKATRHSYDEIAAAYVERIFTELAGKPLDRHLLNRFVEEVKGRGPIADLGCGPGHVARYLHDRGADVFGVDLSPEMIRQARQLSPGLDFRVGDLRSLDIPEGSLAGIVAFYSLIHVDAAEIVSTLREFRRVLAPEGLLLVAFHIGEETVHLDELWGHPVSLDFRFLVPARIQADLREAGFRVLESVEREPYEGAEHPSRRCYLLARKPRAEPGD